MPTPRGMRDFGPDLAILRKEVFSRIEKVFKKFGFDPIETPIIELWDTLKGKYGPEAENKLIYWFKDSWSGKELALRYDLTVPLARFLSDHPEMPLPFKRYAIGRVYRHEEPQKGRYREFYQCDVDIVGSKAPEAEAELLNIIGAIMDEFGLPGYTIKLNDRRLLRGIFQKGFGIENVVEVYRIIDKLDKIGWSGVEAQLKQILPVNVIKKIKDVFEFGGAPEEVLDQLESRFNIDEVKEAVEHLRKILRLVNKGIHIKLDLSLVRGLDYYTGPIFETVVKEPRIGSITGGGRYDELLGRYGKELPAVGTTIGVERLIDAGLVLGIFKTTKTSSKAYVAHMKVEEYAWKIAQTLRNNNIPTRVDLMGRNWRKQMQEAEKLEIPWVVVVGKQEEKKGTVTLLDKVKNKRYEVLVEDAVKKILETPEQF